MYYLRELFNLRLDTDFEKTDESIRSNIQFKSANAWTLVFAIFIASVGLNVNSTAVIIGAMLISPLMGPIVGAGYALGVYDFELLKKSWKNLLIAVGISVFTSMIYFLLSPFDQAQSELLARTSPTFYDVIIAAFGGAAGIIALSRREKGNAIPGVAIATALMPPLCTAGFGLANGEFKYFIGALYLFIINSVFIFLSTYLFVRYMRFKKVSYAEIKDQKKIDRWIMTVVGVVIIPSIVLAWLLLQETNFNNKVKSFIASEVKFKGTLVVDKKINYSWNTKSIEFALIGRKLSKSDLEILEEKKKRYGLEDVALLYNQVTMEDRSKRRDELRSKAEEKNLEQFAFYQQKVSELEKNLNSINSETQLENNVLAELQSFNESLLKLDINKDNVLLVWSRRPNRSSLKATTKFLQERLRKEKINLENAIKL